MTSPFPSISDIIASGTNIDSKDGKNSFVINADVVTFSFIHSIIVVTSPVGVQAPPLFAAIIIIPANIQRSWRSETILRNSIVMTMAVVKLSRIDDIKNVIKERIQRRLRFERVDILSVTHINPPCTSISSTIAIAPIRYRTICACSPNDSTIWKSETNFAHCFANGILATSEFPARKCRKLSALTADIMESPENIYSTHRVMPRMSAVAALFMPILCSMAISI